MTEAFRYLQITFVACVRMLKEQNNGSDYLFEDGTASFPGHVWNERATTAANIREGDWVRVYGLLKHMQGATFVSINSLRALESFDELTYHMLQALSHHLTNDPMRPGKGPLQPTAAASLGLSAIGDDSDRLLSPIQRAVIQVYDKATSEVGLHINSALQSLRSQYSEADIR